MELTRPKGRTPSHREPEIRPSQKSAKEERGSDEQEGHKEEGEQRTLWESDEREGEPTNPTQLEKERTAYAN